MDLPVTPLADTDQVIKAELESVVVLAIEDVMHCKLVVSPTEDASAAVSVE